MAPCSNYYEHLEKKNTRYILWLACSEKKLQGPDSHKPFWKCFKQEYLLVYRDSLLTGYEGHTCLVGPEYCPRLKVERHIFQSADTFMDVQHHMLPISLFIELVVGTCKSSYYIYTYINYNIYRM